MNQIKQLRKKQSLKKSICCYIAGFALLALFLSGLTAFVCDRATQNIYDSYPETAEKYYLTNKNGERLGEGTYIGKAERTLSDRDQKLTIALELIPLAATPVYSVLCILAAAALFYRNRLKEPLMELRRASEQIAENNLDFTITYQSEDELGQLCTSFERMRSALEQNYTEMWRQIEERKRLNAAFAHDLRTPLTVLKGYHEMLQSSTDEDTRKTARTMSRHMNRLEHYVDSMSHLQRLEEQRPEYQTLDAGEFAETLKENAKSVCEHAGKELLFEYRADCGHVRLDPGFIMQVCDNLLANGVRYARTQIMVKVCAADIFRLTVADDGPGFSEKSLKNAISPYYTEEKGQAERFGLGLYICKILCEHHGGFLEIRNTEGGGQVLAVFSVDLSEETGR